MSALTPSSMTSLNSTPFESMAITHDEVRFQAPLGLQSDWITADRLANEGQASGRFDGVVGGFDLSYADHVADRAGDQAGFARSCLISPVATRSSGTAVPSAQVPNHDR